VIQPDGNGYKVESEADVISQHSLSNSNRNLETPSAKGLKKGNLSVLSSSQKTCLYMLTNEVYAHEWILEDNLDKKFVSDSLQQSQKVIDIGEMGLDASNHE